MMTDESFGNTGEHENADLPGAAIEVCFSASNKVHNSIHESDCVRQSMKLSKRPPDLGNGKLAEGASSQPEATESG